MLVIRDHRPNIGDRRFNDPYDGSPAQLRPGNVGERNKNLAFAEFFDLLGLRARYRQQKESSEKTLQWRVRLLYPDIGESSSPRRIRRSFRRIRRR